MCPFINPLKFNQNDAPSQFYSLFIYTMSHIANKIMMTDLRTKLAQSNCLHNII